jgi:hypothetical protein
VKLVELKADPLVSAGVVDGDDSRGDRSSQGVGWVGSRAGDGVDLIAERPRYTHNRSLLSAQIGETKEGEIRELFKLERAGSKMKDLSLRRGTRRTGYTALTDAIDWTCSMSYSDARSEMDQESFPLLWASFLSRLADKRDRRKRSLNRTPRWMLP